MSPSATKSAVLWTGGKDCCLALHESLRAGMVVDRLVTFGPRDAVFRAHPVPVMRLQAQAMGLPHELVAVVEPFEQGYRRALAWLRDERGIDTLITGDIAEVAGLPNWIGQLAQDMGIGVHMPLWHRSGDELLRTFLAAGFVAVLSCIKRPALDKNWLGVELDEACLHRLVERAADNGMDICGENGEYHTLVVDGPLFDRRLRLTGQPQEVGGELVCWDILEADLIDRA